MSLERVTHIEGLESYENLESPDDTNPGAMQVTFRVESEEMPYLTMHPDNVSGQVVRKNFVRVREVINLGNLINDRRICDEVEFVDGKWKIKKLHPTQSDIKKYPEAWNAFARGCADIPLGTPLLMLFKHDPSLVERYKGLHIHSIEQLAAVTDANLESLFMGARENREAARFYLRRLSENAPSVAINNKLEELERSNAQKDKQIADLLSKLDQVLKSDIEKLEGEGPKKRGRKPKEQTLQASDIEGQ